MNSEKIKGILYGEVGRTLAVIAIIGSIFASFYIVKLDVAIMQKDITEIKTNHLVHLEAKVDNINQKNEMQDAVINDLLVKIEKLLTRSDDSK